MSVLSQPVRSATLRAPGATIYYEVRGSGPALLLIPGGPMDAGGFAAIAGHLADRYTVVAYDPRGNSRSTFDGAPEPLDLDQQADDAALLLETLGAGPAFVFGSSGGAQIGLNLAARHPELVRTLVAHEAPALNLLDDPTAALAADQDIHETFKREGAEAALAKFLALTGMDGEPDQADWEGGEAGEAQAGDAPSPGEMEAFARMEGNMAYWFEHGMLPLATYRPDTETLRAGQPRIVVAVGEQSAGQLAYQTGEALARHLGVAPVIFPGDHNGYEADAEPFAAALDRVLSQA